MTRAERASRALKISFCSSSIESLSVRASRATLAVSAPQAGWPSEAILGAGTLTIKFTSLILSKSPRKRAR